MLSHWQEGHMASFCSLSIENVHHETKCAKSPSVGWKQLALWLWHWVILPLSKVLSLKFPGHLGYPASTGIGGAYSRGSFGLFVLVNISFYITLYITYILKKKTINTDKAVKKYFNIIWIAWAAKSIYTKSEQRLLEENRFKMPFTSYLYYILLFFSHVFLSFIYCNRHTWSVDDKIEGRR